MVKADHGSFFVLEFSMNMGYKFPYIKEAPQGLPFEGFLNPVEQALAATVAASRLEAILGGLT